MRDNNESLWFQQPVYKHFFNQHLIFEPLITSSLKLNQWPSAELKLLGQLSCLNKDAIDICLLQQDYENREKVCEMMGLLENCSYIGNRRNGDVNCYFVNKTVQELVHYWVWTEMGFVELLKLYATVLCMLISLYEDDESKEEDAKKIHRSSSISNLRFMAHFDRLLDFARKFTTQLNQVPRFQCPERMVLSIITFSEVYFDESCSDDAVYVLEFTDKLYKGTEYRPHLTHYLSKAYISSPLSSTHEEKCAKAARILEKVIPEGADLGNSKQIWLCVLDRVHLYCILGRPEAASAELKRLQVSIGTNHGEPRLQRQGNPIFNERVELELAIMKRIAEAKVHVARANCSTDPAITSKELKNAHKAYEHANLAISSWFPAEQKLVLEIKEGIAKVLCNMGDRNSITNAIKILQSLLSGLEAEVHAPWHQKRMWGIECEIVCAQMQLDGCLELAIGKWEHMLEEYEKCYGKQG